MKHTLRQERLYSNGYNLFYFCYKGVAGIIIERENTKSPKGLKKLRYKGKGL